MKNRKVHFVSAIPGAGKTFWAVEKITELVKRKSCIVMYVAPTIDLLKEVFLQLRPIMPKGQELVLAVTDARAGGVTNMTLSLTGGQIGDREYHKCKNGDVLFVTHEAFSRAEYIPQHHRIAVVFDEARKMVTTSRVLAHQQVFDTIGETRILQLEKTNEYYLVKPLISKEAGKKLQAEYSDEKYAYSFELLRKCSNLRLDIYIDQLKKSVFEVVLPSKIFNGFRSVLLLAANFKDSQMYHMLLKEGYDMIELFPRFDSEREKKLLKRYRKTVIVPLTESSHPISKWILKGVMVKKDKQEIVSQEVRDAGLRLYEAINDLNHFDFMDRTRLKRFKNHPMYRAFRRGDVGMDVFGYYYGHFVRVAEKLRQKYGGERPLLATHKTYVIGLEKHGFNDCTILPGNPQGLNGYTRYSIIGYIMAVNPSPATIRFFKFLLPGYDFRQDYTGDYALQCVTRTSIRDVDRKDWAFIIVPDYGIANIVQEKLKGLPHITDKFLTPSVAFMDKSKRKLLPKEVVAENNAKSRKDWIEKNRGIMAVYKKRSRLRKKEQNDWTRMQIDECEQKIQAFIKERDEKYPRKRKRSENAK